MYEFNTGCLNPTDGEWQKISLLIELRLNILPIRQLMVNPIEACFIKGEGGRGVLSKPDILELKGLIDRGLAYSF